jgi:hypothetical protein
VEYLQVAGSFVVTDKGVWLVPNGNEPFGVPPETIGGVMSFLMVIGIAAAACVFPAASHATAETLWLPSLYV